MSRDLDPIYSTPVHVVNFLQTLLDDKNSERGFSAVSTARSAISSVVVLDNGVTAGSHPLVKSFIQGVYNLKPPKPRYLDIWDPDQVLNFLKKWRPARKISLGQLVKKLCMLILLATGQRGQILRALNVERMTISKNSYKFIILNSELKQGRQGYKPDTLVLKAFPADKRLCVHHYLSIYLKRTLDIRGSEKKVILTSRRPYKAATRDTLSRWIKDILQKAGICTDNYAPGSTRAASTSKALAGGGNIDEILKSGGWQRQSTFRKWYLKPVTGDKKCNLSEFWLNKWVM